MNLIIPGLIPDKVILRIETIRDLSKYSLAALRNMHEYQVAKRIRLDRQYDNLNCYLNYEVDVYAQMKLAQRMEKVERNLALTEERIRRLQGEMIRRRIEMENAQS
ncbi:MAG: hypothetical protein AB1696_27150 [Planctomycetota bacterium]